MGEADRFIEVTQAAGRAFLMRGIQGPVVMLNLLRFREVADYAAHAELAPETPISGLEAYDRYYQHTLPLLEGAGGEVLFKGAGGSLLIGPEGARWDCAMLVRHQSVDAFMSFASNDAFQAGAGHRVAALEDSRLLPLTE